MVILTCIIIAIVCFGGAVYSFFYAVNNFFAGFTWEALGLSFFLVLIGIIFVGAAYSYHQNVH